MPPEPSPTVLSISHELFVWLRGGELIKHLLESLISIFFLGLAAPLINWLQRDQRTRETARDLKLYIDLLALQHATPEHPESLDPRLLARATETLRQSLEKQADWVEKTAETKTGNLTTRLLGAANVWDYLFSLTVPALITLGMLAAASSDHKPGEFRFALLLSLALWTFCLQIARWSASHFRSIPVRRLFQLPASVIACFVAFVALALFASAR